jgi:threonine/homoserine/homoserine lactone efflux protein
VRGGRGGGGGHQRRLRDACAGAAFGLAALLAASAGAFDAIKWVGAAYLLWLAFGMWRNALLPADPAAQAPGADAPPSEPVALSVLFSQGLLTNVMNPKVAIFFLALLPQFIADDAPDKTQAFLALGAWFVLQSAVFLAVLVLAVSPLRRWKPSLRLQRLMQGASGLLFAGLALRLALAERP